MRNLWKYSLLPICFVFCAVAGFAALPGPIVDGYQQPFLYVYGTISPNPYENGVIEKTTLDVIEKWKLIRGRVVPVKKDVDVTDDDIKNYHLILYGNEHSNKILQKIGKDLPIRITDGAIIVGERQYNGYDNGVIFIAPNPLNPNKYAVVYGALTYHGFPHINAVKADSTDFVIFNTMTKNIRLGEPPDPPLEEGNFDKTDPLHWKVKPLPKPTPIPVTRIMEETAYQPASPLKGLQEETSYQPATKATSKKSGKSKSSK